MIKKILNILKKRWYIFVILVITIGIYLHAHRASEAQNNVSTPYTVSKQILKDSISLSGVIDAQEKADLQFQSAGRLNWVGVKTGDYVKKYQAIASLDSQDLKNRLQKYLNTYMSSRWDLDQANESNTDSNTFGLSQQQKDSVKRAADKAQFSLDNSVLDVELQNLTIQYATLTTPIEGIVTRVDTPYAGVNIIPTAATFEVVNPKTVYFSGSADQTDVVKLAKDKPATITLDAFPDAQYSGKISDIAFTPQTDETGTVYEVKIIFDEGTDLNQYRLGMTGDASFDLSQKSALAVPKKYVFDEGDKRYVMKADNGSRVKTYITVGDIQDELIEVTSGLKEGDVIYD